jgi:hypothetical protein
MPYVPGVDEDASSIASGNVFSDASTQDASDIESESDSDEEFVADELPSPEHYREMAQRLDVSKLHHSRYADRTRVLMKVARTMWNR